MTSTITQMLVDMKAGQDGAADQLYERVLGELKRIARRYINAVPAAASLDATGLVHEAWIRMRDVEAKGFENRAHFFGVAARALHDAAVDQARRCAAKKRGGGKQHVKITDQPLPCPTEDPLALLAIHDAIEKLREVDPAKASLVDMWAFGGLTHNEIADLQSVSLSTIRRQWRVALAFLHAILADSEDEGMCGS